MDIDNLQQNMNTRVVFKEPRGMIRWLQLFFGIVAFSTVADFSTTIGIDITCPSATTTSTTVAPPAPATNTTLSSTTAAPGPISQQPTNGTSNLHPKLVIKYPFDFTNQSINNTCPGQPHSYQQQGSLSGSPQFFVMTGVLSLMYASASLVVYLLFSSTYESIPVWPVADLIITGILCLFWFIASCSFSSGLSLLKSIVTYENVEQTLCSQAFKQAGGSCAPSPTDMVSWSSLTVGVISGFTSFFLWGTGMWFVYKETHFHVPRDHLGPRWTPLRS